MSYDHDTSMEPMSSDESQAEAAAGHQVALDVLHRIGCQYNIAMPDMAALCQIATISLNELMVYTGAKA